MVCCVLCVCVCVCVCVRVVLKYKVVHMSGTTV
jgi:hypothetical protein